MRAVFLTAAAVAVLFPSTALAGSVFLVRGGGWGHGVGMSQWGAEGAALHGWDYERILAHFYPGTKLQGWPARPVRVLLAEQQSLIAVGSAAPFLIVDSTGRKVHVKPRLLRFGPELKLGGKPLVPPLRIAPGAQPLTFDGVGYRGELQVKREGGQLLVVNVVRLDLYLRGVVPYEMPTGWNAAAYEAQAVVARSYALATMHANADFDMYADDRSQVYGGIPAERPETSLALGATAGQVLTYGGRVITAYYHSSSGGRTEAVQDAWPGQDPAPYLVPVSDPFDTISPYHRWNVLLRPDGLAQRFHYDVRDLRVVTDAGGRVARVLLVGPKQTRAVSATAFRRKLGLRSTYFSVDVLSLAEPAATATFGEPVALRGFLRGVVGVVLQERTADGAWRQVARVHTGSDGWFATSVRPSFSTAFRLAVDGSAGDPVDVEVARQIDVRVEKGLLAGKVWPAAPVQLERRIGGTWRPVRQIPVGPSGVFRAELGRAGQYRASAASSNRYLASASRPVSVADR